MQHFIPETTTPNPTSIPTHIVMTQKRYKIVNLSRAAPIGLHVFSHASIFIPVSKKLWTKMRKGCIKIGCCRGKENRAKAADDLLLLVQGP